MKSRKKLLVLLVAVVVIGLGGTLGGLIYSQSFFAQSSVGTRPELTPTAAPAPIFEGGASSTTDLSLVGRSIVYNGRLSLEVGDVDSTVQAIRSLVSGMDGYVADLSIFKGDRATSGTITLRIPQTNFFQAVELIEQLGEVKDRQISSDDVTERQIDLQARLDNSLATEERFLNLLNKSFSVEDVLKVERELGRVRGEIEVLEGQLKFLESRVALASLTVFMAEPGAVPLLPDVDLVEPFRLGFLGLTLVVQGLIVLILTLLPIGAIVGAVYYIRRRIRRRKRSTSSAKED